MPKTRAKKILVHTYRGEIWITTEEFPSISEVSRVLRSRGWSFRNAPLNRLGNSSMVYQNGDLYAELEEALDTGDSISFNGIDYIPVKEWAEKNGSTVRKAKYAYDKGKIEGMTIGIRNYLYIREDCNGER